MKTWKRVAPGMKITILPNGARLVKRYRAGRCFAAAWTAESTDKQIKHDMSMGDAAFYPFNESANEFIWSAECVCPLRFRK